MQARQEEEEKKSRKKCGENGHNDDMTLVQWRWEPDVICW
jgi:hypothetical protein